MPCWSFTGVPGVRAEPITTEEHIVVPSRFRSGQGVEQTALMTVEGFKPVLTREAVLSEPDASGTVGGIMLMAASLAKNGSVIALSKISIFKGHSVLPPSLAKVEKDALPVGADGSAAFSGKKARADGLDR